MYFTVELKGKREVVKLPARASIGEVAKAAFGNSEEPVTVVIATKSLDVANGARCAAWPVQCRCEICDPNCGQRGCVGFHRIHSPLVVA